MKRFLMRVLWIINRSLYYRLCNHAHRPGDKLLVEEFESFNNYKGK